MSGTTYPTPYGKFDYYDIEPMSNTSTTRNWGLSNIRANDAWRTTTGSPYVKVGVLDTGIDATHPSLRNLIHPDMNLHRNFALADPQDPLTDSSGHGTNVAGLIASQNNGKTGVAQNIRLVSLRIYDSRIGLAPHRAMYDAIRHAIRYCIPILNISFGGDIRCLDIERALRDFNGLVVTATGNDNSNNDRTPFYPSSFSHPRYNVGDNVISVGASDENNERVAFRSFVHGKFWFESGSNYGRTTVDIFAPGIGTLTTSSGGGYRNTTGWENLIGDPFWGTSFAAPHVAGVAALMLSVNPNLDGQMMRDIIMFTANQSVGSCIRNGSVSRGIVDAYMAVRMVPPVGCSNGLFFVRNFGDLLNMWSHPNGTFILKDHIYFVDVEWLGIRQWQPIPHFAGTLDGNGFWMIGLNIVIPNIQFTTVTDFGLFSVLSGTVKNLNIEHARITGSAQHNGSWVHAGVIAGVMNGGLMDNVSLYFSNIEVFRQASSIGGLVGRANGV